MSTDSTQKDFAIFKVFGSQFSASQGDEIVVSANSDLEDGQELQISEVMMLRPANAEIQFGTPFVENATITLKKTASDKEAKVIVFKKKRRKGYRKKAGHRQDTTTFTVESIAAG